MIYNSVSGAVVAALAAGEKGAAKGQAWQKLYSSAEDEGGCLASLGGDSGGFDRAQVDYWLAARLHHLLIPRHWNALNAKYATEKAKRLQGLTAIAVLIASPAPQLFVYKAVTTWAIPARKGISRRSPRVVSADVPEHAPNWRRSRLLKAAQAAQKAENAKLDGRTTDSIILPDSFYDMSTWDLNGSPESTRRRWRAGIYEKLDCLLSEALVEVASILEAEGLLTSEATSLQVNKQNLFLCG